jgi:hypothetical protein
VAEQLAIWIAIGSASSLPGSVHPRLLIVTSVPGADFDSEVLRFRLRVLSDPEFPDSFNSALICFNQILSVPLPALALKAKIPPT